MTYYKYDGRKQRTGIKQLKKKCKGQRRFAICMGVVFFFGQKKQTEKKNEDCASPLLPTAEARGCNDNMRTRTKIERLRE